MQVKFLHGMMLSLRTIEKPNEMVDELNLLYDKLWLVISSQLCKIPVVKLMFKRILCDNFYHIHGISK